MEQASQETRAGHPAPLNKLAASIRSQGIPALFIVAGSLFLMNYLVGTTTQIPLMDYWLGLDKFLDVIMNGRLTFFDFVPLPHPLHYNPIGAVFQIVNIRYFHANLQQLIFGAVFWMAASLFLLSAHYQRIFSRFGQKGARSSQPLFAIIVLCLYNLNQWEILTLFASFSFMLRIFFYIWLFIMVDGLMLSEKADNRKAIVLSLVSFFVILGMSQAYFPAFVGAISVAFFVDWLFSRVDRRAKLKQYLIIESGMILATIVYLLTSIPNSTTVVGTGSTLWQNAMTIAKGLLIMLASIFLPNSDAGKGLLKYYIYGLVILMILVISLTIYFLKRMYKVTLLPVMCIFYALFNMFIISLGRISGFGLIGLTSSRYVVETTILLIGITYIMILLFIDLICSEQRTGLRIPGVVLSLAVLSVMVLLLIQTDLVESRIGPHRKTYGINLIQMTLNIDRVKDSDLAPFQAPPEEVRKGIAALKKYDLNIFHNKEYRVYFPTAE